MALTKIGKEGITGVSNSANATFLTATSAEGVTLAGTLAVTGVHTVGTNAIYTSEGGSATKNVTQSFVKMWCSLTGTGPTISDSINLASVTDTGVGQRTTVYTTAFANTAYALAGGQSSSGGTSGNTGIQYAAVGTASANNLTFANGSVVDDTLTSIFCGELA